jgi:hypothetical protein
MSREATQNNENLAGPRYNHNGIGNGHGDMNDRTQKNENLTAPSPDAPLEKDFSRNGNIPNTFISNTYVDTLQGMAPTTRNIEEVITNT